MEHKKKIKIAFFIITLFLILVPVGFVNAQLNLEPQFGQDSRLVPCIDNCTLAHILVLISNVINFILKGIAVPLAAIAFAYAGWLYLTAGGNPGQIQKAHDIFKGVAIGLFIALAAWLIINAILEVLVKDETVDLLR